MKSAILHFLLLLLLAQGQRATAQPATAFDIVSIKPMPPDRHDRHESYCADGGMFVSRGTPLLWAIKWAYDINDYQMSPGWPDWLNSFDVYEVQAKTDAPVTEDQCKLMAQSLFVERFKLSMHRQAKQVSAFALVVAKNGPKLPDRDRVTINGAVKKSTSEPEPPKGWTMARLANYLASVRAVSRPVVDKTALAGEYGFTLDYSTSDGDDRPDIFTALPKQLGLKLEAIKTPIEIFAVDHVERPSDN